MKKITIVATLLAALTGCATYPSDPSQQAQYHVDQARQEIAKGEIYNALLDVSQALKRPTGAEKLRAYLAADTSARGKLTQAVDAQINAMRDVREVKACGDVLAQLSSAKVFEPNEMADLDAKYIAAVRRANEGYTIPFVANSDLAGIRGIDDATQKKIVFDRTVKLYQNKSFTQRDMKALVAFVQAAPSSAAMPASLKAQLPTMNVRRSELDYVAVIDPDFANRRKSQLSMTAHVTVKNADRLFADDIVSRLTQDVRGVTWIPSEQPGALELIVERVRDSERVLPMESRTVTYSHGQVDIMSAALLMPKNASYQFDLKTSGAELEYGYVVSAWKNGVKLKEDVVRGKLGGSYRKCENARVVNVFGGVSSANWMANDDMRSACNDQAEVSIDSLRSQLLTKISAEVLGMPEISEVHSLNL